MRPQQIDGGDDRDFARHGAADADQSLIGQHFEKGVEVFLGFVALRPTAVHGAARQPRYTYINDLHCACSQRVTTQVMTVSDASQKRQNLLMFLRSVANRYGNSEIALTKDEFP